ncbi:MAG: 4Fe-4S protein [Proteobacteria bacterium]|nr:4Fe-4S protein [Pseudomonadota bacterium]
MGHMVAKDIYGSLGQKIDNLTVRTPQTETFHAMLRELYSPEEAELIVGMPFALSTLDRIARVTGRDRNEIEPLLTRLCDKGLVVDLLLGGSYRYMPAPFVIGIFEFTMMRMSGDDPDIGKLSKLFSDYFHEGDFYAANCRDGQQVTVARALPQPCRIWTTWATMSRSSTTSGWSGLSTRRRTSRWASARAGTRSTMPASKCARCRSRPARASAGPPTTSFATTWPDRSAGRKCATSSSARRT